MMSHHQQVFFLFLVLQYKYSKAFSVLLAQFIRIFSVFHFSFYSKIYIFSSIFFLEVFLERNCFESEIIITTKIFSIKQDVSAYTFSLLLFSQVNSIVYIPFYVLCLLRMWVITVLHLFLSFVTLSNVCPLAISPNPCSANHAEACQVGYLLLSFVLLAFNRSCEC